MPSNLERPAADAQADVAPTSDPRRIRALTHPVRLALLECLALRGPLTATAAGEHIGETATTCSFHLRQLARYGFVEDAGAPGRRERPWRLVSPHVTFARENDAASVFAVSGLESILQARASERWDAWRRTEAAAPSEWRNAAPFRSWLVYMSAAELRAFDAHVMEYLAAFGDRPEPPPDALPVQIVAYGNPIGDAGGAVGAQ